MNTLGLNLTAIAVALITFSILLGPLLHISPAVPTIATFGMLGLATLDQLSFKGQGSNLLLDWLAQRSPEHRERVLHHEAGHFLVAHELGIQIQDYSLSAWEALRKGQPGQAGVAFANPPSSPLEAELLDRYAIVWMAGIAAEQLVYGESEGGRDDREKLALVWRSLGKDVAMQERLALLRAKTLLQTHWDRYQTLVAAMGRRATLEECLELLALQPLSP